MFVIAIVAILVFGQRLPQVAGEAAATVQKLRRALGDLRRESGIDQEFHRARREIEENVVRPFREIDVAGTVKREANEARAAVTSAIRPANSDAASVETSKRSAPSDATSDASGTTPPDPEAPPGPHRG